MIAKQSIGKSFAGALNYNLKKMQATNPKERAELLATNFSSMEKQMILKELAVMKALNPKLKRNTWHTSLNFAQGEQISNDKMRSIAEEYLQRMGFDSNLQLIFRHHDSNHPHCHILALRNRFDGTVISDSHNYQKSEAIIRDLENKYGLVKVQSSKQSKVKTPNKDELEMIVRTGKPSHKLLLQQKVNDAIKHSKSMDQFIGHLERHGVNVLFNQASTGRVSGITYLMPGFKIRGQALGNQFKFGSITKQINYEQNRDGQAIGQANRRTTAKFGATTGRGSARDKKWPERYNGINSDGYSKPGKNRRFPKTTPSSTGQSGAPQNADQNHGSNEEKTKANAMDLDGHIPGRGNSLVGGIHNLLDIIADAQLTPDSDKKKNRETKRKIGRGR